MAERHDEVWSGRLGFILATIGSAVGLGSIWKFPYEVGANGGGAFLFFYALGLVAIVVPLMLAEFAIGRRGRGDPATSLMAVAGTTGASVRWGWVGALGVVTGFLILSYYCVIGGWTIGYTLQTALQGLPGTDPAAVRAHYQDYLASPARLLGHAALFIAATTFIVARGVRRGIETAVTLLMPVLGLLLVGLAVYGIIEGDLATTLRFLFTIDWSHVTARAALEALGLGFFSIGVGLGLMITYAAYSGAAIGLRQVAIVSVIADTAISVLAGFAVFPIVFARGLDAAAGPGLVFVTLPLAFADMPFGRLMAGAFFLLLVVAALASAVSLLELVVALLVRRAGWPRLGASLAAGGACLLAGIPTVLSFNWWASWYPLARLDGFAQATVFDLLDYLTSNLLLPIGGLAIALFAGWVLPARVLSDELQLTAAGAATLRFTLRYLAPAGIVLAAGASLLL